MRRRSNFTILVDAVGAPSSSGGMGLWAQELLRGWAEAGHADELVVVGDERLKKELEVTAIRVIAWGRPSRSNRALVQLLAIPLFALFTRPIRILSLNSVVSPLLPRSRVTIINHDWRHIRNPSEFDVLARIYRWIWKWSTKNVGQVIAVSKKTARETSEICGRRVDAVVEPAGNHLSRYLEGLCEHPLLIQSRYLLAFAHYNNKRPFLAVEILAQLSTTDKGLGLILLGCDDDTAEEVMALASQLGVAHRLSAFARISNCCYARVVKQASLLLMLSTDEGYGIPVLEARFFDTPVLVTKSSGLGDIHEDVVSSPDALVELVRSARRVLKDSRSVLESSVKRTRKWSEVALEVRKVASL